ncbi:MAG: hypothetical protein ACO20F_10135 [Robiginitalea sp.]
MTTFRILLLLLLSLIPYSVNAQKIKAYKARVTLIDESKVKGVLYTANEEGLVIMDVNLVDSVSFLDSRNIKILKVRKKGSIGRGAWIGALSGAALGAIIGFADGNDPPDCIILCATAEEKALIGAVTLAVPGTGVGALIGSASKKFYVHGEKGTYLSVLPEIKKYAFIK